MHEMIADEHVTVQMKHARRKMSQVATGVTEF